MIGSLWWRWRMTSRQPRVIVLPARQQLHAGAGAEVLGQTIPATSSPTGRARRGGASAMSAPPVTLALELADDDRIVPGAARGWRVASRRRRAEIGRPSIPPVELGVEVDQHMEDPRPERDLALLQPSRKAAAVPVLPNRLDQHRGAAKLFDVVEHGLRHHGVSPVVLRRGSQSRTCGPVGAACRSREPRRQRRGREETAPARRTARRAAGRPREPPAALRRTGTRQIEEALDIATTWSSRRAIARSRRSFTAPARHEAGCRPVRWPQGAFVQPSGRQRILRRAVEQHGDRHAAVAVRRRRVVGIRRSRSRVTPHLRHLDLVQAARHEDAAPVLARSELSSSSCS